MPSMSAVLRVLLPVVTLLVVGGVARTAVVRADGPGWLVVLAGLVPVLGALLVLHRAKTR